MEFGKQYLAYEEYKELGGTLDETPFSVLEIEARTIVDNYTHGRLKNFDEQITAVKLCVLQLISILKGYAEIMARNISVSSENTDGYSVSYTGVSSELTLIQKAQIIHIIDTYLGECKLPDGTPYLYI